MKESHRVPRGRASFFAEIQRLSFSPTNRESELLEGLPGDIYKIISSDASEGWTYDEIVDKLRSRIAQPSSDEEIITQERIIHAFIPSALHLLRKDGLIRVSRRQLPSRHS